VSFSLHLRRDAATSKYLGKLAQSKSTIFSTSTMAATLFGNLSDTVNLLFGTGHADQTTLHAIPIVGKEELVGLPGACVCCCPPKTICAAPVTPENFPPALQGIYTVEEFNKIVRRLNRRMTYTSFPPYPLCFMNILLCIPECLARCCVKSRVSGVEKIFARENERLAPLGIYWESSFGAAHSYTSLIKQNFFGRLKVNETRRLEVEQADMNQPRLLERLQQVHPSKPRTTMIAPAAP
jgi:hypothetical protein